MFIRSITVKGKKYYRLVESYRKDGKVKQRCLLALCSERAFRDVYGGSGDYMVEVVRDMLLDNGKLPGNPDIPPKALRAVAEGMAEEMVSNFLVKQRCAKG